MKTGVLAREHFVTTVQGCISQVMVVPIEKLTSPSRTTHGARMSNENKAEMILGGSFSSGRKA